MSKIFLFGATGFQGQTILRRLKEEAHDVIAPVRSKERKKMIEDLGADAFISDLSVESLTSEIKKADKVVLMVPAGVVPDVMTTFTENATLAIKEAGYTKTVFVISSTIPTESSNVRSVKARTQMVETAEKHLPKTPILSSTEYLENFSTAYRQPIMENGVIPQTIPADYPVNYLSWDDLASYVLAALESDKLEGKVYPIGGKEGLTGNDLASRLGKVLNKELHYAPVTHKQLEGILTPILGADVAKDYAEFYHWQDTEGAELLNPDTSFIRETLNVEIPSFEEWAKEAFK